LVRVMGANPFSSNFILIEYIFLLCLGCKSILE
jgi:hypothetical protein